MKQIAWFDAIEDVFCIYGVLDGLVCSWNRDGKFYTYCESDHDIFALPRYEWQWNTIRPNGIYYSTTVHFQTAEEAAARLGDGWRVERIEGSKRLVKE